MKKIIFIALGIALLAIVVIWLSSETTKPNLITDTATSSAEASSTSSPLTLASLKARAGWNPTLENDWMYRMEDGVPTLSDETKEVDIRERRIDQASNDMLIVLHYNDDFLSEFCTKKTMSGIPNVPLSCPRYKPSAYNEFIILSKDTGEVLHKYMLKAGYSMLSESTTVIGSILRLGMSGDENLSLAIGKIEHQDGEEIITSSFSYTLNIVTGEITLE